MSDQKEEKQAGSPVEPEQSVLDVKGNTAPVKDTAPVKTDPTPVRGDPSPESATAPVKDDSAPATGDTAPAQDDTAPAQEDTAPAKSDTAPVENAPIRASRGLRVGAPVWRGLLVLAVPMAAWMAWFHPEWVTGDPERSLDWAKLLPLVAIVVPAWLLLLLWRLPKWQVVGLEKAKPFDPKDRGALEDTFRKTFAQVVAGIGAAGALYFAFQANEVAKDKQITEQYAKAVEQLGTTGDDKLAVRLGGLYALERIANGSARDHTAIMEVLTAYVRNSVPWPAKPRRSKEPPAEGRDTHGTAQEPEAAAMLPADVQAILTVLGRRRTDYERDSPLRLDLQRTNLSGANLPRAVLGDAN